MFATSSSSASVACRRQVFAHAHKRVKVYLCHFHVKDCWLKNSIKKVRINNARRQELLERLDKILFQPRRWRGLGITATALLQPCIHGLWQCADAS